VAGAVGFVIALIGKLQGVGNALVWSTVAIYLFFAACWTMALMRKPAAAAAQADVG
jgi:hypothetical protein